jgi:hypothetical protein
MHFETYEPFISLIFIFFTGHGELQITETADNGLADTRAHLYITEGSIQGCGGTF